MLNWLQEEQAGLEELISIPIIPHVVQRDDVSEQGSGSPAESAAQIPKILPVLPLRGLVVFPLTAVPLTIGQSRSIRLVDDVMAGDERLIALVTARDPEVETPTPEQLFTIGTVAMVHHVRASQMARSRLVVQGLLRCRLVNFIQEEPYLKAEIAETRRSWKRGWSWKPWLATPRSVRAYRRYDPFYPRELVTSVVSIEDPLPDGLYHRQFPAHGSG
jgi:ATP-dependent Lon protease